MAQMNPDQFGDPATWVEEFLFWEDNETRGRLETSVCGCNVVKQSYVRSAVNELQDLEFVRHFKSGEFDRYHDICVTRKNAGRRTIRQ
jgi:hypothetical protein